MCSGFLALWFCSFLVGGCKQGRFFATMPTVGKKPGYEFDENHLTSGWWTRIPTELMPTKGFLLVTHADMSLGVENIAVHLANGLGMNLRPHSTSLFLDDSCFGLVDA